MKYTHVYVLFLMFAFCASCGVQNKPALQKEKIKSENKDIVTPLRSNDPNVHTQYEYTDSIGKRLIIQNGYPRGGIRYTDPDGEEYGYAVFWTRIINETDNPLELKIDFLDSYESPSLPGKYFKLSVPPDTMTFNNLPLYSYGLTGLNSFLDSSIHKPSSLRRTINPKESSAFYVVKLSLINGGGGDILRTGLILKGESLFYSISRFDNAPVSSSLIAEKEIPCGSINLKNLILRK